MTFKLNEDRGTILRITFDIVYPSGQMKTVSMSMADYDEFKDIAAIALNEEGVKNVLAPALEKIKHADAAYDAIRTYDSIEDGAETKPTILVMHKDGSVTAKCGGHSSIGHIEKDNPVVRYM